ncbi:MAG TPA: PHB depolymerase family esterase [Acidimicrobiales bacterium]|jgi:polyhydroxybutyrate depolymerase|nr:PHB depolymerase family esterase [Acidimicrobiales bacterium]
MKQRRRLRPLAAITVVVLAAGCSTGGSTLTQSPAGPSVVHRQLSFAGQTRNYRVYVPTTLDPRRPAPLVLVMGGVGDTADSMTNATGFDHEAETGNFVVAYAEGINQNWAAGFCCSGTRSNTVDDVGYLNHLLDRLEADHKIDAARVYAVGVSAGAMMAYRLGCQDADRIAGVGSVAGAMLLDACQPARPVSVIEIHGTADPLVPYNGGAVSPPGVATQPVPATTGLVQHWAGLDTCPDPATTQTQPPVTTTTWSGCALGTGVRLVTIDGGGHTWYATGFGAVNGSIDATHAIWSFLGSLRRAG